MAGAGDGVVVEEGQVAAGASVTFEPGARTAWHTHPLGQTLIVTAMTHIAIQEQLEGKVVEWTKKVNDEQYRR